MYRHTQLAAFAGLTILAACGRAPVQHSAMPMQAAASGEALSMASVNRDVERVRAATRSFRVLDSAVAAGYIRDVPNCLKHPEHGAMGFHHRNPTLADAKVEVERPEIILYGRTEKGDHELTGVEYIVPYRAHPREADAPTVMGQKLKRSDDLKLWYLHVWIWRDNPSGLFNDWNPSVGC
jgi:hypothetical protein